MYHLTSRSVRSCGSSSFCALWYLKSSRNYSALLRRVFPSGPSGALLQKLTHLEMDFKRNPLRKKEIVLSAIQSIQLAAVPSFSISLCCEVLCLLAELEMEEECPTWVHVESRLWKALKSAPIASNYHTVLVHISKLSRNRGIFHRSFSQMEPTAMIDIIRSSGVQITRLLTLYVCRLKREVSEEELENLSWSPQALYQVITQGVVRLTYLMHELSAPHVLNLCSSIQESLTLDSESFAGFSRVAETKLNMIPCTEIQVCYREWETSLSIPVSVHTIPEVLIQVLERRRDEFLNPSAQVFDTIWYIRTHLNLFEKNFPNERMNESLKRTRNALVEYAICGAFVSFLPIPFIAELLVWIYVHEAGKVLPLVLSLAQELPPITSPDGAQCLLTLWYHCGVHSKFIDGISSLYQVPSVKHISTKDLMKPDSESTATRDIFDANFCHRLTSDGMFSIVRMCFDVNFLSIDKSERMHLFSKLIQIRSLHLLECGYKLGVIQKSNVHQIIEIVLQYCEVLPYMTHAFAYVGILEVLYNNHPKRFQRTSQLQLSPTDALRLYRIMSELSVDNHELFYELSQCILQENHGKITQDNIRMLFRSVRSDIARNCIEDRRRLYILKGIEPHIKEYLMDGNIYTLDESIELFETFACAHPGHAFDLYPHLLVHLEKLIRTALEELQAHDLVDVIYRLARSGCVADHLSASPNKVLFLFISWLVSNPRSPTRITLKLTVAVLECFSTYSTDHRNEVKMIRAILQFLPGNVFQGDLDSEAVVRCLHVLHEYHIEHHPTTTKLLLAIHADYILNSESVGHLGTMLILFSRYIAKHGVLKALQCRVLARMKTLIETREVTGEAVLFLHVLAVARLKGEEVSIIVRKCCMLVYRSATALTPSETAKTLHALVILDITDMVVIDKILNHAEKLKFSAHDKLLISKAMEFYGRSRKLKSLKS